MRFFTIHIILLIACRIALSQDIHFSQFYAAPITINPALAGYFSNDFRFGFNYKSQWISFTTPYETQLVSFDFKLKPNKRSPNWFGIGGTMFMDEAGTGTLRNSQTSLNIAYHKLLDKRKKIRISVGMNGSFGQKSINYNMLTFGNQWNGEQFYPFISSGENNTVNSFSFFDVATGMIISAKLKHISNLYVGFSLYHLARPNDSFYSESNRKAIKTTINSGANIKIRSNIFLEPAAYLTRQKNAHEMVIGTNFLFYARNTAFLVGGWFRSTGDFIPLVGFDFFNLRVMTSYDVNISKLYPATNGKGGVEVSLVYQSLSLRFANRSKKMRAVNCPAWSKNGLMMDHK
ncbi:MAG: PorP/SprF family type IX secretion system membrane protein [Bacteroidales bacterium]|nr:PorP/SprF family type IX secretion system membrane protein [Bacteroidales bacterium]MCF8455034.1 PorP/SprF family type IX secretion system membrane protein [Bacteroidales bacterium]